jgi:hypothetical protein
MRDSHLKLAADALLKSSHGHTLDGWMLDRDDLEVPASAIARQLAEATDGAITVTPQTIRNWLRQARRAEKRAGAA